ncbi:hypothetical protein [Roseovarius sp.]|uniref:hypothetical protein n=1 Tax=Roseovarius sp. TaxID=1486281 RepID=UPI0035670FFF
MTTYIELGIVILMAFLLLSLLVTAVTELIASFLKLRAASLRRVLEQMLSDEELKKKFYKNRLLLGTRTDANGSQDKAPTRWTHPSYIAPQAFARALLLALSEENGQGKSLAEQQLSSLRETADKIDAEPVRQLLLGLIDDTKKSISELEKEIAAWYESATDRLSGYFKREQQLISFLVGLALAALFNLDVLNLAAQVHSDNAVRAQLVANAEVYVGAQSVLGTEAAADAVEEIERLSRELEGIALGWPDGFQLGAAVTHAPGWILAALAATLGAPFWFDLLSRFVQIRGTGRKPRSADVSEKL